MVVFINTAVTRYTIVRGLRKVRENKDKLHTTSHITAAFDNDNLGNCQHGQFISHLIIYAILVVLLLMSTYGKSN